MRGPLAAIAVVAAIACGAVAGVLIDGDSDQPRSDEMIYQLLTDADRAQARRVVLNSTELRRLLRHHPFAVESIGVWDGYVLKRSPQLGDVLTIVRLKLERPLPRVRAQWPYVGDLRPCRRQWIPLTVSDLREVLVFVHLGESRVASVTPGRSARVDNWAVPSRTASPCGPRATSPRGSSA
jgi:hypothetical protein